MTQPTEEQTALVRQDASITPAAAMQQSNSVADACREIVKKKATTIGRKQYVQVEGWQAIATAHGCIAGSDGVEKVEGGIKANGYVRRMSDGALLSTAEGFVGDDEDMWANRPEYARRAMAQTRAISRACRSAFAHVVVLIDHNISTTPAEEVPAGGFDDDDRPAPRSAPRPAPKQARAAVVEGGKWQDTQVPFGKNKGVTLGELSPKSLQWYCENYEPKPKDDGTYWDGDVKFRHALDLAMESNVVVEA